MTNNANSIDLSRAAEVFADEFAAATADLDEKQRQAEIGKVDWHAELQNLGASATQADRDEATFREAALAILNA